MIGGYVGKMLMVDLTSQTTKDIDLPDWLCRDYIGGKGFGVKLLYDLVDQSVDPLSPENVLVFATGPLTGTLAPAMRATVVTKSPLTGTICDSYFGGHFGAELKNAGYDCLILRGKADKPCYLYLGESGPEIRDASHLWGLDTYQTYERIKGDLDLRVKIACIGPAGENLVRYAVIDCDPHRQAGRGGTGAVMGSKNLKAVVAKGEHFIPVKDAKRFSQIVSKLHDEFPSEGTSHSQIGTTGAVGFANSQGHLPTRNFYDGVMENADERLGAEAQKKAYWLKDSACSGCPIRCGKLGRLRRGKHRGTQGDITEYETLGLLGSNILVDDVSAVTFFGNLCDRLGIDTISTGAVLSFAMECYEKGILTKDDTGGLELGFGKAEECISMIKSIAKREGLGDLLAEGTKLAASQLGEEAGDYAMNTKGLEFPAWAPRGTNAMGLAYMTNDRGACHMRSWGLGIEMSNGSYPGGEVKHLQPEGIGGLVAWQQNQSSASWSLTQCAFGTDLVTTDIALQFLEAATGMQLSEDEFLAVGERVWNLTRLFNVREGFTRADDCLPKRFREEPLPSGPNKGHRFTDEAVKIMLDEYYQVRGWDEEGVPTEDTLNRLNLDENSLAKNVIEK